MKPAGRVLPLYLVVFIGFVGYSLMITVFTPLLLGDGGGLLPASSSTSTRTLVLGALLALYRSPSSPARRCWARSRTASAAVPSSSARSPPAPASTR